MNRREVGSRYEKLAARELAERGYEILALNYRCRQGEGDIVCRQGGVLVFVEVKYRSTGSFGAPSQAVDSRKQARIRHAAVHYMYAHGIAPDTPCRFDVVGILGNQVEIIENAF